MTFSPVEADIKADDIILDTVTMTGSDVRWTPPDDIVSIAWKPRGGATVQFRRVTDAGTYWTIEGFEVMAGEFIGGIGGNRGFYFKGTNGVVLEIRMLKGS